MSLRSHPLRAAALLAMLAALCVLQQPPSALARSQAVNINGRARVVPGNGTTLEQVGSFSGRPLGHGTLSLRTRLGQGRGAVFTFTLTSGHGSVSGSGTIALKLGKKSVSYRGTADITSGTGAYRNYRAHGLRVSGRGGLTAKDYPIHLTGSLSS